MLGHQMMQTQFKLPLFDDFAEPFRTGGYSLRHMLLAAGQHVYFEQNLPTHAKFVRTRLFFKFGHSLLMRKLQHSMLRPALEIPDPSNNFLRAVVTQNLSSEAGPKLLKY